MNTNPESEQKTAAPDGKKILIVALGGCGAKTLNAFARLPGSGSCRTLLLETDKESASRCTAAGEILRAEASWATRTGLGCGGDPMAGERAFSRERTKLTQLLSGNDFVIVTGGLGGGTATGGVRAVASVLRTLSIPAVFMLTTPFSFESYTRRSHAEQCVNDLFDLVEVLIPLPNDLLFSSLPPDIEAESAFEKAAFELAASVFGTAELFRSRKLLGPDYAEFAATLKKARNTCSFGCGRASQEDGLDRCAIALERMLESPFLGGMDRLSSCNALIVTMTGGDLQLGEMKRTLENLTSFLPAGIQVSAGATINPDYGDRIQLSAIAVHYEQTARKSEAAQPGQDSLWSAPRKAENKDSFEQGLLNLQSYSKGIFSNCPPVKYKDEDLDIPTFQRRGITIDKGGTSR
ncbi:MAG: hypothetical protein IJS14_10185 [Lentisphaeria bacterium]|nr:hypothetical protein [Lentisphaeria bacterium]